MNIKVLILGAGKGTRIGKTKSLLRIGKETFLERILKLYLELPLHNIEIIVNPEFPFNQFFKTLALSDKDSGIYRWRSENINPDLALSENEELLRCFDEHEIRFVINYDYELGQISSIQRGISVNKENKDNEAGLDQNIDGIIIHPVDIPLVSASTVESIYRKVLESQKDPHKKIDIIIPSCNFRRGHPAFFSSSTFNDIFKRTSNNGLKEIFPLWKDKIGYVNTDDEFILVDIDTQEDYDKYIL
ncbi:MAG: NTP transferase domain-containing protein, partial [Actinomycetia bacterium]|nr:NTP transferase domain-containing protein [Actinomycetes bacterium]